MFKKRIVLITGKGGVGRSTSTAALAHVAKARGIRVLVGEIGDDPKDYSPLARHFGRDRLPLAVEEISPGIRGVMLLARTGQEQFLKKTLHSATLARAALSSDALARLLSAGPSFREMGVFFQLLGYLQETRANGTPEHDLIILDMPATGHTLSLTGLPELLLRLVPRGPIAQALREGQTYLNDPETAAAWIVTLPETLPVSEALELLSGLKQTSMPVGGLLLNRVPQDPFTADERAALEPFLDARDLLGAESFRKPILASRESRRLRAGTTLPIFTVGELPHATLIASMTAAIQAATPLDASSPSIAPPTRTSPRP